MHQQRVLPIPDDISNNLWASRSVQNIHPAFAEIRTSFPRSSVEMSLKIQTRFYWILHKTTPLYCRCTEGAAYVGCKSWEEWSPPCQKIAETMGSGPSPLVCFPPLRADRSPPKTQPELRTFHLFPKCQQALFFVLKPQTKLHTGRHAPSLICSPSSLLLQPQQEGRGRQGAGLQAPGHLPTPWATGSCQPQGRNCLPPPQTAAGDGEGLCPPRSSLLPSRMGRREGGQDWVQ